MTVIKINAITVPADSGDELARRFGARAGAVDDQDEFEGFELLKPTDDRFTWLVVALARRSGVRCLGHVVVVRAGHRSAGESSASGQRPGRKAAPPRAGNSQSGVHSELWSYEIAGGSAGKGS